MATDLGVTFDLPLLQAVSDWQRGHSDRARSNQLGQALKKACAHLPIQYRSGHLVCYRRVSLDKQGVMKLLGADSLKEKISSWTFNTEVAKGMKGGVPFPASNDLGVIFQTTPNPQNIIVNIRALYLDADFRDALFQNEKRIKNYDLGAGRYWDGEDEIVLEIDTVTQSNIYSLGGYSSPFDELVAKAAQSYYGRVDVTPEQVEALLVKAEPLRGIAGPRWLSEDATKRVLRNIEPHAKVLYKIKLAQDKAKADNSA